MPGLIASFVSSQSVFELVVFHPAPGDAQLVFGEMFRSP